MGGQGGETRSPALPGRKRSSGPFPASKVRASLRGPGGVGLSLLFLWRNDTGARRWRNRRSSTGRSLISTLKASCSISRTIGRSLWARWCHRGLVAFIDRAPTTVFFVHFDPPAGIISISRISSSGSQMPRVLPSPSIGSQFSLRISSMYRSLFDRSDAAKDWPPK